MNIVLTIKKQLKVTRHRKLQLKFNKRSGCTTRKTYVIKLLSTQAMKIFLVIYSANLSKQSTCDSNSSSIILNTGASYSFSPDMKQFYE